MICLFAAREASGGNDSRSTPLGIFSRRHQVKDVFPSAALVQHPQNASTLCGRAHAELFVGHVSSETLACSSERRGA